MFQTSNRYTPFHLYKWSKQMNIKTIFITVVAICAIVLSACTTASPTTSNNNNINTTTSSTSSNDGASTTAPTTSSSSSTSETSTVACSAGSQSATLTPEVTEGPYYKSVANALLDYWQADANGNYDNSGYTLRGHQFTDANGRYQLTTVVPGIYPGRTEHIHVKVQAPNGKLITTQLFFPGVTQNEGDNIFQQSLLLAIQQTSDGLQGQFNFVVPT